MRCTDCADAQAGPRLCYLHANVSFSRIVSSLPRINDGWRFVFEKVDATE